MTDDTTITGELLTHKIRRQSSVYEAVEVLADYQYIYGPEREHVTARWWAIIRDAIVELVDGRDESMANVSRAINKVLTETTEYSAGDYYDRDAIVASIIDTGTRAYEKHKRKQFKAKLAGNHNTYYGW